MIPAQIHYKLWCRQTKFPRILNQNGQNDLEGQGQWPHFSIAAGSIPWCMSGGNHMSAPVPIHWNVNVIILIEIFIRAEICDKLSYGQGKVYKRTDGWTDRQRNRHRTQATTMPLWPKSSSCKNTMMQYLFSYMYLACTIKCVLRWMQ